MSDSYTLQPNEGAETELRRRIRATDTEIPVMSATSLHPAGRVRIGEEEFVRYSGIGTGVVGEPVLTGCERGVNREQGGGPARTWPGGTLVVQVPWVTVEPVSDLPEPTAADVGRLIEHTDETGQTRSLTAVPIGDGTYEWRDINQPRHRWPAQFSSSFGGVGLTDGLFGDGTLRGLAVSPATSGTDDVLVSSDDRIQRFTANGTFVTTNATLGTDVSHVDDPGGFTYHEGSFLVVADTGNDRVIILGSTILAGPGSGDGQVTAPTAAFWQSDRTGIYIADAGNNRVQRLDSSTLAFDTQWGTAGSAVGQFSDMQGIAVDAEERVWVADAGNHRVQVFSQTGFFLFAIGGFGSANGQFSNPHSIAIDEAGNAWVTDSGNHRVQVFNPQGIFLGSFGAFGTGDGQLDTPTGIAITDEFVYVCDSGNNRVTTWTNPTARETRYALAADSEVLVGTFSGTWDPPSAGAGAAVNQTFTVTGAVVGDYVKVSHTAAPPNPRVHMYAEVTSANTVTVEVLNSSGSAQDWASGTVKLRVTRDPA